MAAAGPAGAASVSAHPARLDHVVVNTLRGMATAAETFAALGFTLTPLGRHSLGSINHLMMTRGAYLELVGVPSSGLQRQDVLDSPSGLNGLVLKSDDTDATYARLAEGGMDPLPPASFSRQVRIGEAEAEARFRTVRLPSRGFPAGRVYFCEHLTPEFVWRAEWLGHRNGFRDIFNLAVADPDPAAAAARYALVCGAAAIADGARWQVRLDAFTLDFVGGPEPRFVSLGLGFADLQALERLARGVPEVTWHADRDGASLTLDALALRLECRVAPR